MARSNRAALAASAVLILTLTWTLSAAGAQPPQLTLTFSGKTITASGLTPRGEAIFFAEAQEEGEYTMLTYSHYERFAEADASGTAHVAIEADIVPTSIWAGRGTGGDPDAGAPAAVASPRKPTPRLRIRFPSGAAGSRQGAAPPGPSTATSIRT